MKELINKILNKNSDKINLGINGVRDEYWAILEDDFDYVSNEILTAIKKEYPLICKMYDCECGVEKRCLNES